MIEHVLIRGVIMDTNMAGQKMVQLMATGADGIRFWSEDSSLIPTRDVVKMPKGKPGDYLKWTNGVSEKIYEIKAVIICKDGLRYDLGDLAPFINHGNIIRIMSEEDARKELEGLPND